MDRRHGQASRAPSLFSLAVAGVLLLVLLAACSGAGDAPGPAGRPTPTGATAPSATVSSPETGLSPVGATETAHVVRIVDGDTIIIDRGRGSERLRYIGMDTPESVKPDTPVQFMAKEAAAANRALVEGREVVLERDVSDRDRYDRLLRYVWLRDGDAWRFVNLELVRQGFAQVATYPPDVRWTDAFLAAQREARDASRGLWGPATPAP